ncbi:MAG: DUF488 domain-containing protein [Rhodospirillaceae bacterium]|nr:DUF488 domain-containing protein [Rhodospirillaceae bacterium]
MKLFTIGFTQKTAETFFTILKKAGVKHLIDIRLHNVSQLAGFTKRDDLAYFAKSICRIPYTHATDLAPTEEILNAIKKAKGRWGTHEKKFMDLMAARKVEKMDREMFEGGCLLCSEPAPHHCHRRLVAEYLGKHWKGVSVTHL